MSTRSRLRHALTRRAVLGALGAGAASLGLPPVVRASGRSPMSLALIGQCLIRHDLRARPWPGFDALAARLRSHDACFSDLEVAVLGPRAGAPTRTAETLHTAEPVVLDTLRALGVTVLATANNHAYDLGTGGILDTMAALRERGIPFAGTGANLAEAAAPAFQQTPAGRLAVVAAASGMIRPGGAATATRPGVNELRAAPTGGLDESDVQRLLDSLGRARAEADVVLAYLHNHLWESDVSRTPEWQRALARRCIDAGASAFVAHGPPLLHGVEVYRGAPLFHGLGSFVFQTRKPDDRYGDPNWESVIAECRFERGRFAGARLAPVQLARVGVDGPDDLVTRGRPSPATTGEAAQILGRLAEASQRLGHRLRIEGAVATIPPG